MDIILKYFLFISIRKQGLTSFFSSDHSKVVPPPQVFFGYCNGASYFSHCWVHIFYFFSTSERLHFVIVALPR